jgi:hypothetical protein
MYIPITQFSTGHLTVFPQSNGLRANWFTPMQSDSRGVRVRSMRHLAGFWFQSFEVASGHIVVIVVPAWFGLIVTGALPALWIKRRLAARRAHPPGCCPTCGYDLRATPERCPECGNEHVPSTQPTAHVTSPN